MAYVEWIRTWPAVITPDIMQRACVSDNTRRVFMDRDYAPVLAGLADDTVILEWDIAASLEDRQRFAAYVARAPGRIHVAPYRLYPASTGLPAPVWAHRTADLAWIPLRQSWCDLFGLGLAYIPLEIARAFSASCPGRADDTTFSQWHHRQGLGPVPVHWDVRPVHLHY